MIDYPSNLNDMGMKLPMLVKHLQAAQETRRRNFQTLSGGARLRGVDCLLAYLDSIQTLFEGHHRLKRITFLIERAKEANLLAIESALAGYYSAGIDATRTIMEIEFLLRDFRYNKDHLEEWLSADYRTQAGKFGANAMRQRYANQLGISVTDLRDSTDYKMHSRLLHVTTSFNPFGGTPGVKTPKLAFGEDAVYWEIFEHNARLLAQVHGLKRRRAPRLPLPHPSEDKELSLIHISEPTRPY